MPICSPLQRHSWEKKPNQSCQHELEVTCQFLLRIFLRFCRRPRSSIFHLQTCGQQECRHGNPPRVHLRDRGGEIKTTTAESGTIVVSGGMTGITTAAIALRISNDIKRGVTGTTTTTIDESTRTESGAMLTPDEGDIKFTLQKSFRFEFFNIWRFKKFSLFFIYETKTIILVPTVLCSRTIFNSRLL